MTPSGRLNHDANALYLTLVRYIAYSPPLFPLLVTVVCTTLLLGACVYQLSRNVLLVGLLGGVGHECTRPPYPPLTRGHSDGGDTLPDVCRP
ncbi:hypothetical protein GY45DRAFT_880492 [Cubamyces sp. BRFM 1775]|nr:hypothetical protein GY45DRAFT_880492 [Cubamyces sp. BRFM 1775]